MTRRWILGIAASVLAVSALVVTPAGAAVASWSNAKLTAAVQALQGTDTTQNSKIASLQNALKSGGVITSVVAIPGSPGGWNVTVKVNGVSTVYPVHNGVQGADGESAYQLAVDNGFVGSQSDWLASLVGAPGSKGDTGDTGQQGPAGLIPTYNYFGTADPSVHAVFGGNSEGNVNILGQSYQFTLSGAAAFTSAGSYACYGGVDDPSQGALTFTYQDGTHFTPLETGIVQGFRFECIGF